MHISQIMLRWYKSFNSLALDKHGSDQFAEASWNQVDGEAAPFVRLELDRHITTVVGANEAGKSHLLSGISKAFTGGVGTAAGRQPYDKQDICRYCGFDHLETTHWPQFVIELSATTPEEESVLAQIANSTPVKKRVWILINGEKDDAHALVFQNVQDKPSKVFGKEEWKRCVNEQLPEVRFIAANKELANEVHVRQLLDMYGDQKPSAAYDPVQLQRFAEMLVKWGSKVSAEPPPKEDAELLSLKTSLGEMKIGPTSHGQLETLLFRDVLQVPLATLKEVSELASTNQPYIYRIVSDIQNRIDERLDLSRVWQQDPDLRMLVDFEAGFFYFRVTDRTGIKYTFEERSSGLKYFLSYYIQSLALIHTSKKRGLLVLMDEPDGFLSAAGQRNLLHVFENLVDGRRNPAPTQLVYTTHSPFLINKNYPHRVRLVRKGDGAEGSQVVDKAAFRRFEPIRSALGVDYADTLFVGTQNVIVEGPADQRLLTAGIQAFGADQKIDAWVDLNRVVFVAAGGAARMKEVIRRSIGGTDDKLPVAVALFDGDTAGAKAYQEIELENLLPKEYLIAIDQIGITNPDVTAPQVLEDLIPVSVLAAASHKYLKGRWAIDLPISELELELRDKTKGKTLADRLKGIWLREVKDKAGIDQDDFRASVIETISESLVYGPQLVQPAEYEVFRQNLVLVCKAVSSALAFAAAAAARDTSKKRIRYHVADFRKSFQSGVTKADIARYLSLMKSECQGTGPQFRVARGKLEELQTELDAEAAESEQIVDRTSWLKRFEQFSSRPW